MKPEFLEKIAVETTPVGSRVTCDPPPTDTDEDWLILVRERDVSTATYMLESNGFQLDNPNERYRPEQSTFNSWRGPNNTNLIVTFDANWHHRFLTATKLAKRFNLMTKNERVSLFQAVLYGVDYESAMNHRPVTTFSDFPS